MKRDSTSVDSRRTCGYRCGYRCGDRCGDRCGHRCGDRCGHRCGDRCGYRWSGGLPPNLGVEVETPGREPTLLEDRLHDVGGQQGVGREHVRVPAEHRLVAVGVDRAELATRGGGGDLVLTRVARHHAVVGLEIEREAARQPKVVEEAESRLGVVVVLVRRRLARLGLEQQLPLEADGVGEVGRELEELRVVLQLLLVLGVQQAHVAVAASPEDKVLAAEAVRDLEPLLDLRGGAAECGRVGVGRRAVHVPIEKVPAVLSKTRRDHK